MFYLKILLSLFLFVNISFAENIPSQYEFTDYNGETFNFENLKDDYYLLNFFFTSCPHICPAINGRIATLYREFENIKFVSITVDPERDTPEKLKTYAEKFKADPKRWHFLYGPIEKVNQLLSEITLAEVEKLNAHSTRLILVEPNNKIIKFYRGLDNDDFKELKLKLEEIP